MKPSRFFVVSFGAALFFAACGGNDSQTTTDTTAMDTSTRDTTTTSSTAPGGYDTSTAYMLLARHRVRDFTRWKASYDAHDSLRQVNNLRSYAIGRSIEDSNNVFVAVTADSIERAKAFSRDRSLKEAMQKGGVTGTPVIQLVAWRSRNTSAPGTELRAMTTFTVRDWEAWRRSFDSGRQMRLDNGIVERAYGHEVDNNRKVVVIVSVTDSARAAAFWNSDTLKQRRAASGVVGRPERFVYRVVQRY